MATNTATTATHTLGPWLFEPVPADAHTDPDIMLPDEYKFWIAEARPAGHVLAVVEEIVGNDETTAANARLIAAAPELLQLVREARELLDDQDTEVNQIDWLKAAVATIAKVDGRS